jgi:hypothetical protein
MKQELPFLTIQTGSEPAFSTIIATCAGVLKWGKGAKTEVVVE